VIELISTKQACLQINVVIMRVFILASLRGNELISVTYTRAWQMGSGDKSRTCKHSKGKFSLAFASGQRTETQS
jgi:hypothetical protein